MSKEGHVIIPTKILISPLSDDSLVTCQGKGEGLLSCARHIKLLSIMEGTSDWDDPKVLKALKFGKRKALLSTWGL